MKLAELFKLSQDRLNEVFAYYLKHNSAKAPSLQEAMAYSVFNGGKRIRASGVYTAHYLFDAPLESCDAAACAIESIHAYSLIHDDLPAMDNADFRRGKPASHKQFGEATAILAGDGLQDLAFKVLASHSAPLSAEQRIRMINILSDASGSNGMIAGQIQDLEGTETIESLTKMYQLKTGALLSASFMLGAAAANIKEITILNTLNEYSSALGLAFQIQDDLLDYEDQHVTGKPHGIDIANNKKTFPFLLGIEPTQTKINELFNKAIASIQTLGKKSQLLKELAVFLMERQA